MSDYKIQWHSGFAAAMDLELAEYRDFLTYEREYNLNRKPLEIDLLVIKKDANIQIKNEIGSFFSDIIFWKRHTSRKTFSRDLLY